VKSFLKFTSSYRGEENVHRRRNTMVKS